jgi:hypothetical protein
VGAKLEQNFSAAIRFQRLLERFLELLERVNMLHCGGERSIGYQVVQLLVNLLDLWAVQRAISVQLSSLSLSRALMLGEVASSQITSSNPLSLFRHWPATRGVLLTFLTGFPDHLIGPTTEW